MAEAKKRWSPLDTIEFIGNKLPDPAILFLIGALLVMALSQVAVSLKLGVQPKAIQQVVDSATGEVTGTVLVDKGDPITPVSLLTADGIFWCLSSMVKNFTGFAPLGVVLTGMLGIGVAERTGFIGALLKGFMLVVPRSLVTPTMVFLGIMSSMAVDAGYIVLPPIAAALYKSLGRSPLAGIAAVFAGVAAGFNANLFVTGLDPMLSTLTEAGASVIDPNYKVTPTCNWLFMIASTILITLIGWGVSVWIVERRFENKSVEDGGPVPASSGDLEAQRLTKPETRALFASIGAFLVLLSIIIALVFWKDSPLYGQDPAPPKFDRWVAVIVPLMMLCFVTPGGVYGILMGKIKGSRDFADLFAQSMANMAPIIVLAFFAAQFIEYFKHSKLDVMLAHWGGGQLAQADLSPSALMVAFIVVTLLFNLIIGSMSAKYTMFAPIFVPMFMMVGISPELTQASYRIGDSVTNCITPLNSYLIIILVFMRQFVPKSGMGSLIAMMLPYSIAFAIAWTILLVVWINLGITLGIPSESGPLRYIPAQPIPVVDGAPAS